MTITFFSNFLNHHQLPLCLEIIKNIGVENFKFVACEPIHEERTKMGYEDMNLKYPFVLRAYESKESFQKAIKLAEQSDVAIIGAADNIYCQRRAESNKLTFLFRERIFKNGSLHRFFPTSAWKIYKGYTQYRNKNFYILCASAYAADDFSLCGFPRRKCLKWGYFPEFKEWEKKEQNNGKLRLMWCGRMLWWKHPEHAVEVARMLKERNVNFEMLIVGNGENESKIKDLVHKYKLEQYIQIHGFMTPDKIRENMETSDIYLFTSGREEGWGVVLNEAMNSRCAVIANTQAGSSTYLLDNQCGCFYNGTMSSLKNAVNKMLHSDIHFMGERAYERIKKDWNPQQATRNLLEFINKSQCAFEGPCSIA